MEKNSKESRSYRLSNILAWVYALATHSNLGLIVALESCAVSNKYFENVSYMSPFVLGIPMIVVFRKSPPSLTGWLIFASAWCISAPIAFIYTIMQDKGCS